MYKNFIRIKLQNTKNTSEGFTLIELIIVVALMAISVGVTSDILVSLIRTYNKSEIINEIEQNTNFFSQKLLKELRNAESIDYPVAAGDTGTSVIFTDKNDVSIEYGVDNNVIYKDVEGNGFEADEALTINNPSSGVGVSVECPAGACFTKLSNNPDVVQIDIVVRQAGSKGGVSFTGDIRIQDTIVTRETY